ncbi:MAG: hypothetical protein ACTHJ6_05205 [Oryzihumus sp.]
MTETLDQLRDGLHQAATGVHDTDLLPGVLRRSASRWRRRRAVAAGVAAVALVAGGLTATRPADRGPEVTWPAVPTTPPLVPPIATFTPPPVTPTGPSQSETDARWDHVLPEIAALSVRDRVDPLMVQDSPDGAWVVSRLPDATAERMKPSFQMASSGNVDSTNPGTIAPLDYGELLLMDPTRTRIVRAFPLPALVPQALKVTAQDVWVARIGDQALPDSMVGHYDRRHHAWSVMVYPSPDRSRFNSGPDGAWSGPEWQQYQGGVPGGPVQTPVTLNGRSGVTIRVQPQGMRILDH